MGSSPALRVEPENAYVMDTLDVTRADADRLRQEYWAQFGTTLAGLMDLHGIDPDPYLREVHDSDFSVLAPDPELAAELRALPGRKIVYTNGSAPYAEKVLEHRGLCGIFSAVYGVEHAGFRPKPEREAFETVFARDGLQPQRAAMFEDDARNLHAPHGMGMQTVHVAPTATAASRPLFREPQVCNRPVTPSFGDLTLRRFRPTRRSCPPRRRSPEAQQSNAALISPSPRMNSVRWGLR